MQAQRYRCAPIAALVLAGASFALLPGLVAADGFSSGMQSTSREVDVRPDAGFDWHRPHFDRRRFEEARRDMDRRFEDHHEWRDRDFHHEHHHGFMSGMMAMHDHEWHDGSRLADKTPQIPTSPGVAKNGPGNTGRANQGSDTLVGNRVANRTPVAAPGAAKNAPGGQMHHGAKGGNGKQSAQACAKMGQGNQAANKNNGNRQAGNNNGGPGNFVGNQQNGNNNRGFGNQKMPVNAAAKNVNVNNNAVANNANPQAANKGAGDHGMQDKANGAHANNGIGNRQQGGNLGNLAGHQDANAGKGHQACAKQGPGNNATQKNAFAKPLSNNKNGNINNFAQMRGNLVGSRPTSNANQTHHQAGNNKSGSGHTATAAHRN